MPFIIAQPAPAHDQFSELSGALDNTVVVIFSFICVGDCESDNAHYTTIIIIINIMHNRKSSYSVGHEVTEWVK